MIRTRNVVLGARLLRASRALGDDSPDALAGAMFEAAFMLSMIPDSRKGR